VIVALQAATLLAVKMGTFDEHKESPAALQAPNVGFFGRHLSSSVRETLHIQPEHVEWLCP
jgi:hypothetical protein